MPGFEGPLSEEQPVSEPAPEPVVRFAEEWFSTPIARVAVEAMMTGDMRKLLINPKTKKQFPLEQIADGRALLMRQKNVLDKIEGVIRGNGGDAPLMMSEYIKIIVENGRDLSHDIREVLAEKFHKSAFVRRGWVKWNQFDWTKEANPDYQITPADRLKILSVLDELKDDYALILDEYDEALGNDRGQAAAIMTEQAGLEYEQERKKVTEDGSGASMRNAA